MKLVLFLLCGGFVHFTFASNRLRIFNLKEKHPEYTWDKAPNECKSINESLVTLYDEEDANFTDNFLKKMTTTVLCVWLGLRRNRPLRTTWSDNNTIIFRNFTVNVTDGEQRCIAIVNNTWTDFECSDKKPFMCSRGNNYTLIDENVSWCQALQYCRNNFNNLVSISNKEQNQAVIEKGNNKTFWIGLMYDEWKWEDNGCSSYRKWDNTTKGESKTCPYCSKFSTLLGQLKCDMYAGILCSKGSVRIKVIKQNKTWEEAFNHCEAHHSRLLEIQDGPDQQAVEQWLNNTDAAGPFWIALRQSHVFGFWIWSDRPVKLFNNWRGGRAPEMPFSQHCGVIETDDYKWRDEDCSFQRHFLCEEDIIYM